MVCYLYQYLNACGANVGHRSYVAQRAPVQDEPVAIVGCLDSEIPIRARARDAPKRVPSPLFAFGAEAANISAGRTSLGLAQVCLIFFFFFGFRFPRNLSVSWRFLDT